jgi:nucleotide-binding universal stress UspA family protein
MGGQTRFIKRRDKTMSYKTIVVHVDSSPHAAARIDVAAAIALAEGAHLIGAAMTGISRFAYPNDRAELAHTVIAQFADVLSRQAHEALERFDVICKDKGVHSFEQRLIADDPEGALVLLARFCDLVVVGQTDPNQPPPGVVRDLPENVMLNCGRPTLIVPNLDQPIGLGRKALLAWNGRPEAAKAISDSIPLLRHMAGATVARIVAAPEESNSPANDDEELIAYLARQGIEAEMLVQCSDRDAGEALLSLASDSHYGLIVMGGYGHARFREFLLGGVTRTMLYATPVAVLMSH